MNKFSAIVENFENIKYFKIDSNVNIVVKAFSEGEASYMADSTMASVKGQTDYKINSIVETTKDEYNPLTESYGVGFNNKEVEDSDEDKILKYWTAEFGDRTPTTQEKFEFYHNMRSAGFDGILFHQGKLKNKIFPKEK
jgi:hypothetical protein